jgi:Mg-chelatase subunit ChlD
MPEGSQVVAAAAGTVILVEDRFTEGGDNEALKNFANRVVIAHDDGHCSLYLHLQPNSVVVVPNQQVYQGQSIAKSGRTGYVTGAHLHFQLQQRGIWWEQSVQVVFDDVPGGVPKAGSAYASANCPDQQTTPPKLRIDGGEASQKRQLETFAFLGTGFTPGTLATQHVQHPDGSVNRYSAVATPNGTLSWSYTPPCTASVGMYTVWVDDAQKGSSNRVSETVVANASCIQERASTATILVMDVSGSMGERWKGGVKIDSAKEAALQFIEQVTNESRTRGGQHMIGVVAFSAQAQLLLPLTSDYQRARQVIISLSATNSTNVGAGLTSALTEFDETRGETQRLIILLSDGNSNTGLSKDQVLSGPVVEALRKHVCVHTVAFGDPSDVDSTFLRRIASGSGCGSYSLAQTGFELFSTFLKLRDASLGQIAGEYSSAGRQVTFVAGSPVALGTIIIGSGKDELHLTLAWSADGTLQARLKDPSGRLVTSGYPGAEVYSSRRFSHVTVYTPSGGAWTIEAAPTTQMPSGTEYYAVLSTRPGGFALPLPLPVFTIGGQTFGLPAGLPTWLLVAAGVALLALAIYAQLSDLW